MSRGNKRAVHFFSQEFKRKGLFGTHHRHWQLTPCTQAQQQGQQSQPATDRKWRRKMSVPEELSGDQVTLTLRIHCATCAQPICPGCLLVLLAELVVKLLLLHTGCVPTRTLLDQLMPLLRQLCGLAGTLPTAPPEVPARSCFADMPPDQPGNTTKHNLLQRSAISPPPQCVCILQTSRCLCVLARA